MRIIAGDYKGRKLITPNGADLVRPTAEKVKGAIFSMLMNRIEGAVVCDLFAGTAAWVWRPCRAVRTSAGSVTTRRNASRWSVRTLNSAERKSIRMSRTAAS